MSRSCRPACSINSWATYYVDDIAVSHCNSYNNRGITLCLDLAFTKNLSNVASNARQLSSIVQFRKWSTHNQSPVQLEEKPLSWHLDCAVPHVPILISLIWASLSRASYVAQWTNHAQQYYYYLPVIKSTLLLYFTTCRSCACELVLCKAIDTT